MQLVRFVLLCLVAVCVVSGAFVPSVRALSTDWCDDVQAVHVPIAISKGDSVKESGNGTSSTDAGASLCEPVKPINVVWTSYATFNPDGPGTVKVQWDNKFFFELSVDLPRGVCNATFSSPYKQAIGGCYPCVLYTSKFSCYFDWLGNAL